MRWNAHVSTVASRSSRERENPCPSTLQCFNHSVRTAPCSGPRLSWWGFFPGLESAVPTRTFPSRRRTPMDKPDEAAGAESTPIEQLAYRLSLCEAELRAQNAMIRALILCHPAPDLVEEAFEQCAERSISGALGSASTDASIRAFEFFRNAWLDFLGPGARRAREQFRP